MINLTKILLFVGVIELPDVAADSCHSQCNRRHSTHWGPEKVELHNHIVHSRPVAVEGIHSIHHRSIGLDQAVTTQSYDFAHHTTIKFYR